MVEELNCRVMLSSAPVLGTTVPTAQEIVAGSTVTFTATATGSPTPDVQWQVSTDGGNTFANIVDNSDVGTSTDSGTGITTSNYIFSVNASESGNQYQAVFTNSVGSVTTVPVTLTVDSAPSVTASPSTQTVNTGATVQLSATATDVPGAAATNSESTVVWYVNTNNGAGFTPLPNSLGATVYANTVYTPGAATFPPATASYTPGSTTSTYTFTAVGADSGYQYEAVFTNKAGQATTSVATLTVNTPPVISVRGNPVSEELTSGQTTSFTAAATGSPNPTVQWQVETVGSAIWTNINGAVSTSLNIPVDPSESGNQYRAEFTNAAGVVDTTPATLTVDTVPVVASNPTNTEITAGQTVTFTATSTGASPNPTAVWYISTDGGSTFNPVSGGTTATNTVAGVTTTTYSFVTAGTDSGDQFYAVFTNTNGLTGATVGTATTTKATLQVDTLPANIAAPASVELTAGQTVTFTSTTSGGSPAPTAVWYVATAGSSQFNPITDTGDVTTSTVNGVTTSTYSFVADATQSGNKYEVVYSNNAGSAPATAPATLTVDTVPVVASNPTNKEVTAGQTVTFTATSTGASPNPTAVWYESTGGGAFAVATGGTASTSTDPITGVTTTTYSFVTAGTDSGDKFYAVFTNTNTSTHAVVGTATTTTATLQVDTLPGNITNPASVELTAGQTVTFTSTTTGGSPNPTAVWYVAAPGSSQFNPITDTGDVTTSFNGVTGVTTTTYSFPVDAAQSGSQYEVVFSNAAGSAPATTPATLTVDTVPVVASNPTNTEITAGQTVTFTATSTGASPNPTAVWYESTGGGAFAVATGGTASTSTDPITGVTTTTYSFVTAGTDSGDKFYAVFTNTNATTHAVVGTATTTTATLQVDTLPGNITNPASVELTAGQTVTFTSTTTGGSPTPTAVWYVAAPGSSQFNPITDTGNVTTSTNGVTGATTTTYSFQVDPNDSGSKYEVVFSNAAGSAPATTPATLTVDTVPVVASNPTNTEITAGQTVTFTATSTGASPNPTAVWYESTGGGAFVAASGGTTSTSTNSTTGVTTTTYSFVTAGTDSGDKFYAVFTNTNASTGTTVGTATTSTATLQVDTLPGNITAPTSVELTAGQTVTFTSTTSGGSPAPTAVWYVAAPGSSQFNPITDTGDVTTSTNGVTGVTTTTYSFPVNATQSGNQYEVIFSNAAGSAPATPTPALLTVDTAPTVATNPTNTEVTAGQSVTFTATSTGASPNPTAVWYESTPGSGGVFTAVTGGTTVTNTVAGVTTTTYTFTTGAGDSGDQFYAVFTNTNGTTNATVGTATTTTARLTVDTLPVVTVNPTDQEIVSGHNATFTASVTGSPAPSVQWYVSTTNGSSFVPITDTGDVSISTNITTGVTTSTYSFPTDPTQTGNKYYAVFTTLNGTTGAVVGTANSTVATLTVDTLPSVTQNPTNVEIITGQTATFTAAASGSPVPSVQWQVNTGNGAGFTDIVGATSTTYSVLTNPGDSGYQYQAVFTSHYGSGAVLGTATTSAATLTVDTPPVVTTNPQPQTIITSGTASFSAAASCSPQATVQWQVSTDGVNFVAVSAGTTTTSYAGGVTSTTYSVPVDASESGYKYRAVFTNNSGTGLLVGTATTAAAQLTIQTPPSVTTNPTSQTITAGQTVTFTAAATGSPIPTVQWQVLTTATNAVWTNVAGVTTPTYTFTVGLNETGYQYRAVFTNSVSTATTSAATLTVDTVPAVTSNPTNQTAVLGQNATFSAAATGIPAPNVQWQFSVDGGQHYTLIGGATSTSYTVTGVTANETGYLYQAVFTNPAGSATTTAASLTVQTPPVVTANGNPVSQTIPIGQTVTFTAAATGSPNPTVQWQVLSTASNAVWTNIPGQTSTSYTFTVAAGQSGYQYRAVFTNAAGTANTSAATLTVQTPPVVSTNPLSQTITAGNPVSFTAIASGSPAATVVWQYNTGTGSNWTQITSGITTTYPGTTGTNSTLTFTTAANQTGYRYEAVFTNAAGTATTTAATLTVQTPPVVTTSPVSQAIVAGKTVTFTAAATGSPTPTVQWQVLTTANGATWTNIAGATSTSYTFTTTAAQNGYQYQAVFSNATGITATTTAATLTIATIPVVSTSPITQTITSGNSVSFTAAATGSPAPTVVWQYITPTGTTWTPITTGITTTNPTATSTSSTVTFTTAFAQTGYRYEAVFTNVAGVATTSAATLTVQTPPAVTANGNPVSQTIVAGKPVTFTAAATGSPTPTVQWQVNKNDGNGFTNISGATSTSYTFTTAFAQNGYLYQAVFSNATGQTATTTAATLTVQTVPAVTTSPLSQTITSGNSVTFTAVANGSPAPTVVWQYATPTGTTWTPITTGVTTTPATTSTSSSVTFTTNSSQTGYRYEAVFTNAAGVATTATATLTVQTPPSVTTNGNPVSQTIVAGKSVTFTAAATGSPTPTVQWQVNKNDGNGFTNIAGATSTSYTFTTAFSQNGYQYQAVFSNATGIPATTTAATLTVQTIPVATTSPITQTITSGNSVSFTAAATGSPAPTVVWQYITPTGTTWTPITTGITTTNPTTTSTSSTVTFTTAFAQTGNRYEAVFTNAAGVATTSAATLTVQTPPSVTSNGNPVSQTIVAGKPVTFTAAATGSPTPTVQWQVNKNDGNGFTNISGATSTSYTFTTAFAQNGYLYQAVFSNATGQTATTTAATLTVETVPAVTTSPLSQTITSGNTVNFTAVATGSPAPTVVWQYNTGTGSTWTPISTGITTTNPTTTSTSSTLSFSTASGQTGYRYEAVFTNAAGVATTTVATLTVQTPPSVTATGNPVSQTIAAGKTATFTAAATGSPTPTVQWYVNKNDGNGFVIVSGATSTTYTFTAATSQSGYQYEAVFSNATGITATTTAATLTVQATPLVTTNPVSVTAVAGNTATFTAAASGFPLPTVQWMYSTGVGVGYTNVTAGMTTDNNTTGTTLKIATTASMTGYKFEAVFTNAAGSATTTAATLTVQTAPVVTANGNPGSQTVNAGQVVTFTAAATGNPAPTVQWQVLTTATGAVWTNVPGATSTTYSFTSAAYENGYQYRAVFTNAVGTANTSAATLTVQTAPALTANPVSQTFAHGSTVTFTASASGTTPVSVQWYVSADGGNTWSIISGATNTTLSFAASVSDNGKKYRAVFTNVVGSTTSASATLTVT